jgi:hypothetical protein
VNACRSRQPVAAKQLDKRVPLGGKALVWEIEVRFLSCSMQQNSGAAGIASSPRE